MTDSLEHIVVPYARFVECRERRKSVAAELTRRERRRTMDGNDATATAVRPAVNEQPVQSVDRSLTNNREQDT